MRIFQTDKTMLSAEDFKMTSMTRSQMLLPLLLASFVWGSIFAAPEARATTGSLQYAKVKISKTGKPSGSMGMRALLLESTLATDFFTQLNAGSCSMTFTSADPGTGAYTETIALTGCASNGKTYGTKCKFATAGAPTVKATTWADKDLLGSFWIKARFGRVPFSVPALAGPITVTLDCSTVEQFSDVADDCSISGRANRIRCKKVDN